MNREVLSRITRNNSYKLFSKGTGLISRRTDYQRVTSYSISTKSFNLCHFNRKLHRIPSVELNQPRILSNSIRSASTQRFNRQERNNGYSNEHSMNAQVKIVGFFISAAAAYYIIPNKKADENSEELPKDTPSIENSTESQRLTSQPGESDEKRPTSDSQSVQSDEKRPTSDSQPVESDEKTFSNADLDSAFKQTMQIVRFAMKKKCLPGLSINVSVNGKTLISKGLGASDIENNVQCSSQTVYRIASISKPISATIAMRLKEVGVLDLDLPITHYVPTWPAKHLQLHKVNITMRQLLSHSAGVRHYSLKKPPQKEKEDREALQRKMKEIKEPKNSDEYLKRKHQGLQPIINQEGVTQKINLLRKMMYNLSEYNLDEFYINQPINDINSSVKLFSDDDLIFKPGTNYSYSSHGYTLVSLILENVSQSPFVQLLPKIFRDMRLNDTYLDYHSTIIPNRARCYIDDYGYLKNAPYVDNSYKWAGGGLLSTVRDLDRFGQAMLYSLLTTENCIKNKGMKPGILRSKSVKEMWSPFSFTKNVLQGERTISGYGLGWIVRASTHSTSSHTAESPSLLSTDRLYVNHTGAAIGASSILAMSPTAKCTFKVREAEAIQEKGDGGTFLKEGERKVLKYCEFVEAEERDVDKQGGVKGVVVSIITNKSDVSLYNEAMEIIDIYADLINKLKE